MNWIISEAAELQNELIRHRRWLHKHAEVGFNLAETLEYVSSELKCMGINAKSCGKAGLIAVLGKECRGKTLLLRADMDALPIPEENVFDFSCTNGNMHACGHDMHTAMLLGAAKLLKKHESMINGSVKLMFQPAEESFEGATDMIQNNVLSDPEPDAAVMIHVSAATPLAAGTIIVCPPGISAPAADYFSITVKGKGCHGSTPHMGVDALNAASHILIALQEIHARELSVNEKAVLTIGTFQGGTGPNILADTAVLTGTIRSFNEQIRCRLKTRIEAISRSVADAFRATVSVDIGSGCPTFLNDKKLAEIAYASLQQTHGSSMVLNASDLGDSMGGGGSEDFAYISHRIPTLMLILAAGHPNEGYIFPQHHPKVTFDESVLFKGTAAYISFVFGYLSQDLS